MDDFYLNTLKGGLVLLIIANSIDICLIKTVDHWGYRRVYCMCNRSFD